MVLLDWTSLFLFLQEVILGSEKPLLFWSCSCLLDREVASQNKKWSYLIVNMHPDSDLLKIYIQRLELLRLKGGRAFRTPDRRCLTMQLVQMYLSLMEFHLWCHQWTDPVEVSGRCPGWACILSKLTVKQRCWTDRLERRPRAYIPKTDKSWLIALASFPILTV